MSNDRRRSEQDTRLRLSYVVSQSSQNGGQANGSSFVVAQDLSHPVSRHASSASLYPIGTRQTCIRQRTASHATSYMNGGSQGWDQYAATKHLPWSKRMKHVTWAYFTLTMATGGVANMLSAVPFKFHGLHTIGLIFFFLNIALYLAIWAMILTRFYLYPHAFTESLTHPTESLFVPAFAVSFGTILITIVEYGANHAGEWLTRAILVLFWFDCALAIILSLTVYMVLWSTTSFTIAQMTPIWIFPAYPLLIIGPHAANLSARLPAVNEAIQVIVGGFTIQGIGFLVALTIYSAFVYRLMTEKLPAERLRPGMFVSVGPSAFTVSGTIGMALNLDHTIGTMDTFMEVPGLLAAQVLRLVANWMSLWLWGLAIYFFFISLISNMSCFRPEHRVPFAMTWFSFVFPQTALVTATFAIAKAFDVQAIRILGCVMTVMLIVVWFLVVGMMIRAVFRKDILWPEKGEDKAEGGFRPKKKLEDEEHTNGTINGAFEEDVLGMNGTNGNGNGEHVSKVHSNNQSLGDGEPLEEAQQQMANGETPGYRGG